ncbi:MAG: hypothetical protein Q4B77_02320 [Coriobacteriaceae bacterium]|nr:hypothetical protein [Coriobacteriaceae bacterium]
MAAACFIAGFVLFTAPLWGYDDAMRVMWAISWLGIFAGASSVIASFATKAPQSLRALEPVIGALMLACGLWTLYFPVAVEGLNVVLFGVACLMAFYLMGTAWEMERRGVGRWPVQLLDGIAVLGCAFFGLFGLAGAAGLCKVFALSLYVAAWGFVYACTALSIEAEAR